MPEVIFAKPTHEYGSYSDLWKLVELSGYPLIYTNEWDLDNPDHTYIFSTPSTFWYDGTEGVGFPNAKARVIYYNVEYYLDKEFNNIPGVEVWSADAWFADLKGIKYVPMGSHPGLFLHPDEEPMFKQYDVVTLWAASGNRYTAIDKLDSAGIKRAPDGWGEDRHLALAQSKAMCISHQWPDKRTVAPQRWALAAAYRLPMITETLDNPGIFTDDYRLMCDLQDIGTFTAEWMKPENSERLCEYGERLYQLLCVERTFRKQIEGAL